MKRLAFLLLVTLLCTAGKPRRAYLRVHDVWTESLQIYNNFGSALLMEATYLHPSFREHLAAERKRLLGKAVDEEDHSAFLARMSVENASFHEVLFGADSNDRAGKRFGDSDDGWRLRFLADGTEETLESIYRVRTPNTLQIGLYPQIDQWNELWIARFHRTVEQPDTIILHVGSGLGNGSLTWQDLRSR